MFPVNLLTSTSSTSKTQDSSNPEDQDIWFDAIDYFEMEETWFDTREDHQADLSSSAGEAADSLVPFTEDCRRGVQLFVRTLSEYAESKMLSVCLSKILPGTPTSLVIAANSLYTAITQRQNIDAAALHTLGLASWYLPENINVVSRLATFIRDFVTSWTDDTFMQQFLGEEENHISINLFTALAVTTIVGGRWMKDEGAPQRGPLKIPAFMANILIRASHYWTALGNMARSIPSGTETPENNGPSCRVPAFEVDTQVEMTGDICDAVASCSSSEEQLTAFSSNSTAFPGAYTQATVQNRPATVAGENNSISAPEKLHYLAVEKFRQNSELSELQYCANLKTSTRQLTNEKVITNTYFNTRCDATAYPEPLMKAADSIPVHTNIPETQVSSAATDRSGGDALIPLVMTGTAMAPVATTYLQALKSKTAIAAGAAVSLTGLVVGGKLLWNKLGTHNTEGKNVNRTDDIEFPETNTYKSLLHRESYRVKKPLPVDTLHVANGVHSNTNKPLTTVDDGRSHPPLPKDAIKTNGPISPNKTKYNSGTNVCEKGEVYSAQRWQWASYEVCVDTAQREHNPKVSFTVTDTQYYWGGAWYRFNGSENTSEKFTVGVRTYNDNVKWVNEKPFGRYAGPGSNFTSEFLSPIGSHYVAYGNILLQLYWRDDPIQCSINCHVGFGVRNKFTSASTLLNNAINSSTEPMIYRFSNGNQIPAKYIGSLPGIDEHSIMQDAYLIMIPTYSTRKAFPYLFGDTHNGVAERCENNPDAITDDGTRQDAEMWTASEIWYHLGTPDLFFNGNYFDIRPQQNGQTWQSSRCSTPVGMYFDNNINSPSKGTHNKNKYFPGPTSFVSEDDELAPVDTMFFVHTTGDNYPVGLVVNLSNESTEAIARGSYLINQTYTFSAISGTALLHNRSTGKPSPDAGDSATTRLAISYDNAKDRLFIMMGGSYRNGFRRVDIEAFFRAMGLKNTLELDGGGSASLGLNTQRFIFKGASLPPTSCTGLNSVWCAPITQPDGKARSIPSWIGINVFPRP
ncbi:phosphodiester glycosidase family protein [Enterobacter ludwigii]|uniref:phosphodiester glycosidase family protein n=1 Tax=Enterobacter ludwigii TaxID=299767 RepID=UPI003974DCA1